MSKPNFAHDLKQGQRGELAFIVLAAANGIDLTQTDGRAGDCVDKDGNIWEIKADQYNHDDTSNFFMELYSDVDAAKKGGPSQAVANGCRFYAYYFAKNDIAYIFDSIDLLRQLDNYLSLEKPRLIEIHNRAWISCGVKVPRNSLIPLLVLKKDVT